MKYTSVFIVFLALIISIKSVGQDTSFGITAGLLNGGEKFKSGSISESASDTGFYIGINARIPLNDNFIVVAEIDYGNLESSHFAFASVRAQYYVVSKFYLQAGPQVSYLFDDLGDNFAQAGIDLSLGLGYDISEQFRVQARYSFELTNRSRIESEDITSRLRWLQVGLEYSF